MSEFREAQRTERVKGQASWHDKIMPELSEDQQRDLTEALEDRDIYPSVIAVVLRRWGHQVTPSQISWHRKRHGL